MPTKKTAVHRPSTELSPAELHAIARAGKAAEKVRDHLEDDTVLEIDITVRFHGMLTVGSSELRERATKPDACMLLGLVLEVLPTGERNKLQKRLDTIFQNFEGCDEWPEAEPQMRILAETAIARWTKKEERKQRGAVSGVIVPEVIARGGL